MKLILLLVTTLILLIPNLLAVEMPDMLKMRIGQMGIGQKSVKQEGKHRLKSSWPNDESGLFQGIWIKVKTKITTKEDHLKAISSIPKRLMKDRVIGATLEIDGWFYTSIEHKTWKIKKATWFNVIASSKNSEVLHFSHSW